MNILLKLAFLFCVGSIIGWGIEVLFRRFVSYGKWINPGFCQGPYLPIYGVGLTCLYLISMLENVLPFSSIIVLRLSLFAAMAVIMTVIEYIGGLVLLKVYKIRLWDYTDRWGNIQGLICPLFSLFWTLFGALYYFLVNPRILSWLEWLSRNLAFSFFIGVFYGVFILDFIKSADMVDKMKRFAEEKGIVIRVEHLKIHMREVESKLESKTPFIFHFRSPAAVLEHLKNAKEAWETEKTAK